MSWSLTFSNLVAPKGAVFLLLSTEPLQIEGILQCPEMNIVIALFFSFAYNSNNPVFTGS